MYYCVHQGNGKPCFAIKELAQCDYCAWYQAAIPKPSFQMPAIKDTRDPLWYWMYSECLRIAGQLDDEAKMNNLLIEVLRR